MPGTTDIAYNLALDELRLCYDEQGIVAGRRHYDDYWTRDAAFGCLGALLLNDTEIVDRHLQMLKGYQKNGMIPFLVRKNLPLLSMLGPKLKIWLFPQYRSHKALFMTEVIDSNPYFVILAAELIRKGGGRRITEYQAAIESALGWCRKRLENDLAVEGPIAGWNDGIYKKGSVLITNVLFWKAFSDWENLCVEYKIAADPRLKGVAARIKAQLDSRFFNGRYYIDWIDREKHDFFDANANLLAVYLGLAGKKKSGQIMQFIGEHLLDKPLVRLSYPSYPAKYQELFNRLFGMGDYTGGLYWPEPALLYILSLARLGKKKEAGARLEEFAARVVEHRGVHEIYTEDKKPLARWQYRAEYPYARGAALYILANNSVRQN
jgi:glycogen debranching enzyme